LFWCGGVARLREKLPAQSPKDLIEALTALQTVNEELRSLSTQNELMILLRHRDPKVRQEAARTIAEISRTSDHAASTVMLLKKNLDDPDVEVRSSVLLALSRMGPNAKPAVPHAIKEMQNQDPRVRRAAIALIGNVAPEDEQLIPVLINALDDSDVGIAKLGPGYNSVGMLAMMRLAACKNLAKDAAPKLAQIYEGNKNDEFYRSVALRTLIAVSPEHPLPLAIAKECLKRQDIPSELQKGAITLSFLGPNGKAAIPELIAVLKLPPLADAEQERKLKSAVLSAFGAMGPAATEVLPYLRSMRSTQDSDLRAHVNQAIENIERSK
jgi:HEAT repeat protein